ncbi:MAG: heat-shock protein [Nitrospira bacterium SG8_35_1]|nr:MAG: heat-shock protein [Nitrospira bacterium SG8_35_1]
MQLTKWDPFREMEDVFDRYSKTLSWPRFGRQEVMTRGDWIPRVDITETDKEFIIKADLPEVKKEEVKISVDNGVLSIQGERKQEKEEKNKKFHRVERFYGNFTRSFTIPENVDETNVEASFKDGTLTIQLPKTTKSKPKAVNVEIK